MGDLDELKRSEVTGYRLQVGFEPYSLYREDLYLFYFFHLTFFLPLQKKVKSLFAFFLKKVPPMEEGQNPTCNL